MENVVEQTAVDENVKRPGLEDVLLKSGKISPEELRNVRRVCRATIGSVGNQQHENVKTGKAGRSRWAGRRPKVRGIAMNPVDHPHGGGEGRSKGNHPTTPWGKPTKGYRTRGKRHSDKYIVARRKRGK